LIVLVPMEPVLPNKNDVLHLKGVSGHAQIQIHEGRIKRKLSSKSRIPPMPKEIP